MQEKKAGVPNLYELGLELLWVSQDTIGEGLAEAYGYFYGLIDCPVFLNDNYGASEKMNYNIHSVINTITHEVRLQFQFHAVNNPDTYQTPEYLIND